MPPDLGSQWSQAFGQIITSLFGEILGGLLEVVLFDIDIVWYWYHTKSYLFRGMLIMTTLFFATNWAYVDVFVNMCSSVAPICFHPRIDCTQAHRLPDGHFLPQPLPGQPWRAVGDVPQATVCRCRQPRHVCRVHLKQKGLKRWSTSKW